MDVRRSSTSDQSPSSAYQRRARPHVPVGYVQGRARPPIGSHASPGNDSPSSSSSSSTPPGATGCMRNWRMRVSARSEHPGTMSRVRMTRSAAPPHPRPSGCRRWPDHNELAIPCFQVQDTQGDSSRGMLVSVRINNIHNWVRDSNEFTSQMCFVCADSISPRYFLFVDLLLHLSLHHPHMTLCMYLSLLQRIVLSSGSHF